MIRSRLPRCLGALALALAVAAPLAPAAAGDKAASPKASAAPAAPPCVRCADLTGSGGAPPSAGLEGRLVREGDKVVLVGCAGRTELEGMLGETVEPLVGREAWLKVICTDSTRAAALGGHALGDSVVDIFAMGLCPFARALEHQMAPAIAADSARRLPAVRLHIIFYSRDSLGTPVYFSKHGEKELREGVVQLALQELEPARLWAYLDARSKNDDDWAVIAGRVGVTFKTVREIQRRLDQEIAMRAGEEWNRNAIDWPAVDFSPTVFWRGREVAEIGEVPGFGKAQMPAEHCGK